MFTATTLELELGAVITLPCLALPCLAFCLSVASLDTENASPFLLASLDTEMRVPPGSVHFQWGGAWEGTRKNDGRDDGFFISSSAIVVLV